MRVIISIFSAVLAIIALTSFGPQSKPTAVPKLQTLFACKQGGKLQMSAQQFLEVMKQPICAKDSLGAQYKVTRFEIQYAETGLYQDSTGLPIIHTDYQFANFAADTIHQIWIDMFSEHAYKGDTIRILNVRAKKEGGLVYRSSDLEIVLR